MLRQWSWQLHDFQGAGSLENKNPQEGRGIHDHRKADIQMSVIQSPEASSVRMPGNQSPQVKGCLCLCPPSYIDCRDLTGRDTEITRDGQNQPEQGSAEGQPIMKI